MLDGSEAAIYGFCAIVYVMLAGVGLVSRSQRAARASFIVACLATALWAGLIAASASDFVAIPAVLIDLGEVARSGGWLYFLLTLWLRLDRDGALAVGRRTVTRAWLPILIVVLLVILPYALGGSRALAAFVALKALTNIVLPVVGLLLIENLLRVSGSNGRWRIKHLCLALGTILTVDFFVYADALVLGFGDGRFVIARGLITALVAPLILSSFRRLKGWQVPTPSKLTASPKVAFYSVALVASGAYLLTMGAVAYYIRTVGETWGGPLQLAFMVAALLVMLASLSSSQLKSHARLFILKNFFAQRYDYREEWLRFIRIVSTEHPLALNLRLARAIADLMDSPASALWVLQADDTRLVADAVWNLVAPHPAVDADSALIVYLRRTCRTIDIDEYRAAPDRYDGLSLPAWLLERPAVWLIVPLVHRGGVLGFVVLDQARAARRLDWEDRALLNTSAVQAASYLAEERMAEALRAARRLEDFNRQFAFVVHDVKNVVGQMAMMMENAKKYGDNPAFQRDMVETVGHAVTRMRAILEQLTAHRHPPPTPQTLDLPTLLGEVAARWGASTSILTLDAGPRDVPVVAIAATLTTVLDLLIDNAVNAAGPQGHVVLRLQVNDGRARIEVTDDGPGMAESFVNHDLFRLLATTKSSGYGIGAYQTRHLVSEMGATLEVESVLQHGTTMRIVMAIAGDPAVAPAQGDPENDVIVLEHRR